MSVFKEPVIVEIDWHESTRDAMAWCSRASHRKHSSQLFRSVELLGVPVDRAFSLPPTRGAEKWDDTYSGVQAGYSAARMIATVIERRRALLPNAEVNKYNLDGRILVYEAFSAIGTRLAEKASHGLLDASECPGWDTWIGMTKGLEGSEFLLCWIPSLYEDLVAGGIIADPTDAIYWLDSLPSNRVEDLAAVQKALKF